MDLGLGGDLRGGHGLQRISPAFPSPNGLDIGYKGSAEIAGQLGVILGLMSGADSGPTGRCGVLDFAETGGPGVASLNPQSLLTGPNTIRRIGLNPCVKLSLRRKRIAKGGGFCGGSGAGHVGGLIGVDEASLHNANHTVKRKFAFCKSDCGNP